MRQWQQSQQSVRAFCQDQGLAEANFYAWRRTLPQRDADRAANPKAAFVPVHVLAEQPQAGAGLELVLGGGRVLRVAPGFDAPTLQRLLTLLAEGRPC